MFSIKTSHRFHKELKQLAKRYRSLSQDFAELLDRLEGAPLQDAKSLGKNCYKIRMPIASKGKGKSGGARVITYIKVVDERVVLLSIYDKSEKEDLQPGELEDLLSQAGLD